VSLEIIIGFLCFLKISGAES